MSVAETQCGHRLLTEHLAVASVLAGRFAHDFDNVLMGVLGFAELAQASVEPNSEAYHLIADVLRVAEQGRRATRQMHRFSHSGRRVAGASNLAAVWAIEARELSDPPHDRARIAADIPCDLPDIAIPPDHLRAVINSVVSNALEAAGVCGCVQLCAVTVDREEPFDALPEELLPGQFVELTIRDDGPGFSPELLDRIAEAPFSTTKVRHRGLGLSIALLSLATYGGGLIIEPASPRGTTVILALPTRRADASR
ncbi:MAG: ATP-binding protein [Gemmataceae bacterium]